MRSIKFPDMFNTNSTNVWKSKEYLEATKQNSKLALLCERGELFGDPYYGMLFKHYYFNQNSRVLKDAVIDMIYTQLALFIPQLWIKRTDINIIQDKAKGLLICQFAGTSQIDFTVNTFELVLYSNANE